MILEEEKKLEEIKKKTKEEIVFSKDDIEEIVFSKDVI